jgi:hypothetical protein
MRSQTTVPAGTVLHVRTVDPIDVKAARPGSKFKGTVADPVQASSGALIPRGAPVLLQVVNVHRAGPMKGRDRIDLKIDSITLHGKTFPVASAILESRSGRKGNRTLRGTGIGAAAGAVIGGIAGGGTGLAVGSLVGGGTGTAVAAASGRGKHLMIPPETVLTFQLQSPLKLR